MGMGNCKDCKFWEHHIDMRNKTWSTCDAPNWVKRDEVIGESDFAFYADSDDDSGLDAGLKTGPLFGCVNFQPRKRSAE